MLILEISKAFFGDTKMTFVRSRTNTLSFGFWAIVIHYMKMRHLLHSVLGKKLSRRQLLVPILMRQKSFSYSRMVYNTTEVKFRWDR